MIGQGLFAFLSSQTNVVKLCQDRIYPVVAPANATYPFVIYSRISCEDVRSLNDRPGTRRVIQKVQDEDGPHLAETRVSTSAGRLTKVRMQIDCYAPEFRPAELLGDAIREVLNGYKGQMPPYFCEGAWRDFIQDIYHQPEDAGDKGLFRVRQDFWISYKELT